MVAALARRGLPDEARRRYSPVFSGQTQPDHVPNAILPGVLRGEALAQAFANLNLLVFPSRTGAFCNVVLEALCSGVPAVVTAGGGPKFLIQPGVTGWIVGYVNQIMTDVTSYQHMRRAAREYALGESWDAVFEQVFRAYGVAARKTARSRNNCRRKSVYNYVSLGERDQPCGTISKFSGFST